MPDLRQEHARGQSLSRLYQEKATQILAQTGTIAHGAAYASRGPGPWRSIGPRNINGRVKCLAVDPRDADVVYAGAATGGVWKTDNGGGSWRPLGDALDCLAIGAIAVPQSGTVYAAHPIRSANPMPRRSPSWSALCALPTSIRDPDRPGSPLGLPSPLRASSQPAPWS